MVCRQNSKFSSVIITFARDMSGLYDSQVLGLSHALMQEERERSPENRPQGDELRDQHIAFINKMEEGFANGELRMKAGSHHPAARFEVAREETPDPSRLYAAERIVERAARAGKAQQEYINKFAQELGVSHSHAISEYAWAFYEAKENPRATASPAFERAWVKNPDNTDLPVDRRSLYAFEKMEIARAAQEMSTPTRPAVTREPVKSSAVKEIGYDPINGRMEIVLNSKPDHVYGYRMSKEEYTQMRSAESLGSYYAKNVRGNQKFQYATEEEAKHSAVHYQCASCGEFAGESHVCPPVGSKAAIKRDVRIAVNRARQKAAGLPQTGEEILPTVTLTGTKRYATDFGSIRMAGIHRVLQQTRRHSSSDVEIVGNFRKDNAIVRGNLNIEYNGRANGYDIAAVTDPGDSGERHLRCTCARYKATYYCEHLEQTVTQVRNLVNENAIPSRKSTQSAATEAANSLTTTEVEATELAEHLRTNWEPVEISLVENPQMFDELYQDARNWRHDYKAGIAAGLSPDELPPPVPYIQEAGAMGGLCTRESGQGIGIEVEHSYPPDWTEEQVQAANKAIGEELYALGLTSRPEQENPDDVRLREPSTEHDKGWSFVTDTSTGTTNVNPGGEVISPIMFDEKRTWIVIPQVLSIIKKHGGIPSRSAGLHVHVSSGGFGHRVDAYNRLLASVSENEDLLYRLNTNPYDTDHRISSIPMHCAPNPHPSSPYTNIGKARDDNMDGKTLAVNFESVHGKPADHIEFRYGDSSLDEGTVQTQMLMFAALVAAAAREQGNPRPNTNRTPLGSHVTRKETSKENLTASEKREQETISIRQFVDRYIPGGGDDGGFERVQQVVRLFGINNWVKNPF